MIFFDWPFFFHSPGNDVLKICFIIMWSWHLGNSPSVNTEGFSVWKIVRILVVCHNSLLLFKGHKDPFEHHLNNDHCSEISVACSLICWTQKVYLGFNLRNSNFIYFIVRHLSVIQRSHWCPFNLCYEVCNCNFLKTWCFSSALDP